MKRREQLVLIVTFLGFCWLGFQAVHELGHVAGAWLTGGRVTKVVLHPWAISRTDIEPNPHPLLVVWAGPLVGAILPLMAFLVGVWLRAPGIYLFRFFAGSCLIANGCYIGFGCLERAGDAGVMLALGSGRWTCILFGLATAPLGLYLWHGQGKHFGLGPSGGKVNRSAMIVSAALLLAIVSLELALGGR
jgi:hypothetical protein